MVKYLLSLGWVLNMILKGISVNINPVRPFTAGGFSSHQVHYLNDPNILQGLSISNIVILAFLSSAYNKKWGKGNHVFLL